MRSFVHRMPMIDVFVSRLSLVKEKNTRTLALGRDREGRITFIISLPFRF